MKNLICSLVGHDFKETKKVTDYVSEFQCLYCKKEMSTNGNGHLTPLTSRQKEINLVLHHVHKRKKIKAGLLSANH
ncbi:MAG TPA: hypothetical protein VKY34_03310 [Xanthomarina sp.]|nr:hypothetical protein [Xanthomarina sp.]